MIPDGLVLGGPLGNEAEEPFSSWLESCQFSVTTFTKTVYTPYVEALAMWEECVATAEHHHAPLDLASPLEECGPAPTPEQALPNGTIPMEVLFVHKGTPHGSVQYSLYIYKTASTSSPADPVNLFFYGNGNPTLVASKFQFHSSWRSTGGHHSTGCSSQKYVRIDDASHGGTNAWHGQRNMQEKDSTVSHASGDCLKPRYHSRYFGPGPTDTHTPSFGRYLPAAVHHELQGHKDSGVTPTQGRVQVQSDVAGASWVGSYSLLYVGNFGCNTCSNHDGYELNVRVL